MKYDDSDLFHEDLDPENNLGDKVIVVGACAVVCLFAGIVILFMIPTITYGILTEKSQRLSNN